MNQQHHPLYQAIGGIVGQNYVRDDQHSLITYSKDMSSHPAVMPGIVVRPGTTEEVSQIVKLANRTGYPVTLRGGGQSANGVTKGVPTQNIVIDLGRMNKVKDIDVLNERVEFGAGARPIEVDQALKSYGYFIHTVLGPYHTDSMGGLLSGVQGAGYPKNMSSVGLDWHHILGLKVVLPTGEIITTGAGPDANFKRSKIYYREAASPDITGLFLSGGGTFGIITEITMRIYRLPEYFEPFGYIFDELSDGWKALLELSSYTPTPHSTMFFTNMDTVQKFGTQVNGNYCMLLSIESDSKEDIAIRRKKIDAICQKNNGKIGDQAVTFFATEGMTGTAKIVRETASQVCPFLSYESLYPREGAMEMLMRLNDSFLEDSEKIEWAKAERVFYAVPIANYILMGVTMHWDDSVEGAGEYLLTKWRQGADMLNDAGSSTTYTQGNNSNKIAEMWSPAYYNIMRSLKNTLDPNNIMCPGLWNL